MSCVCLLRAICLYCLYYLIKDEFRWIQFFLYSHVPISHALFYKMKDPQQLGNFLSCLTSYSKRLFYIICLCKNPISPLNLKQFKLPIYPELWINIKVQPMFALFTWNYWIYWMPYSTNGSSGVSPFLSSALNKGAQSSQNHPFSHSSAPDKGLIWLQ